MTQKKIVFKRFVLGLLFILPLFVHSQTKLPVKLGLKVSPNLCWMNSNTTDYNYNGIRGGVTVGFVSDIYFMERYAVNTGLNFLLLGANLLYPEEKIILGDTISGNLSRKYSLYYLEIPIMIKMQTKNFGDFSFFGQFGFGTGFRLSASANDNFSGNNGKNYQEKFNASNSTTLIRESVIIGIGGEYHLDKSSHIFVGLSYSNSLNNVLTGYNKKTGLNEKAWLNFAELTLGFFF